MDDITPGRGPYVLAVIVLLAGGYIFADTIISSIGGASQGLVQVEAPGESEINLTEAGDYTIFYEYRSVVGGRIYSGPESAPSMEISIMEISTGSEIPVSPASFSSEYDLGSRAGRSLMQFNVERPGTYMIRSSLISDPDSEVVLAVGHGFVEGIFGTILKGLIVGFGTIALALGIAAYTYYRRQKAMQERDGAYVRARVKPPVKEI